MDDKHSMISTAAQGATAEGIGETGPLPVVHARPLHMRWQFIGVVAAGGVVGTAAREGLALVLPGGGFPAAVFTVNLAGAFLLGFLLEALARRGRDVGLRRLMRLGLGTGVLGGFTTYSTLAVGAAAMAFPGSPMGFAGGAAALGAIGYSVGTVVAGASATFAGILVAHFVRRQGVPRGEAGIR